MNGKVECPYCREAGKRIILGEITPDGLFTILRYNKGVTKIKGESFTVICGDCNQPIYVRNISFNWEQRVFGQIPLPGAK